MPRLRTGGTILPPLPYLIMAWCIMNYQCNLSLISPCWMVFIYISPLSNENSIVRKNYSPGLFFTPPYMSSDTFVICLSVNSELTIIWRNIILVHLNRYDNSLGLLFLAISMNSLWPSPANKAYEQLVKGSVIGTLLLQ